MLLGLKTETQSASETSCVFQKLGGGQSPPPPKKIKSCHLASVVPWISWPLKLRPISCPETSVRNYHCALYWDSASSTVTCVGDGYSNWFILTCCVLKADYCFILNRETINRIWECNLTNLLPSILTAGSWQEKSNHGTKPLKHLILGTPMAEKLKRFIYKSVMGKYLSVCSSVRSHILISQTTKVMSV